MTLLGDQQPPSQRDLAVIAGFADMLDHLDNLAELTAEHGPMEAARRSTASLDTLDHYGC